MSKEIRFRIRSVRYEVEASLFSAKEEEELCLMPQNRLEEPEVIEINTLGKRQERDGRVELSYEETEATGMNGSTTAISFLATQPGVVSMIREGSVSTVLVFETGKRHHCVYNTPFMPFEVCVHTLKVDNRLEQSGSLDLDYIIEIRGARAERTKFHMELL